MVENGIGARVRRKEDFRFLTGQGTYTDDMNRPGQAHVFLLRSPHAHARLKKIDARQALAAPGVIAVITGADLEAAGVGPLPCGWQIFNKDGTPAHEPPHPVLAVGRVRHVGDPVAAVIAETRALARDGAEKLVVDYDPLPSVTATAQAAKAGAPAVHDGAPNNVCFDWHFGDAAAVDQAFAKAAHVTTIDLYNNRLVANAIEPRAAIGEYDPAADRHTLYTASQNPHVIRLLMGAYVLKLPEAKLRVVSPDVGGGFGSKIYHYAEEALVTWAAKKVGRPVKWTADRSESFISDAQGRDHVTHAELALDKSGKFLALRVQTTANLGGYLSTFSTAIPTYLYATLLAGLYTTPAIYCGVKAVFTNTVPVDAYRGAGRPEACFVVERLVEKAAQEMGLDKTEIRRKNFVPKSAMPYQTPVALQYDSGDFITHMEAALKLADHGGAEKRRADAKKRGKLLGVGLSTYIEACGIAPSNVAGALGARAGLYESAEVRFHPTGTVTLFTGSHSHGQSHETTFAQLIAEGLGVPIENVEVVHGDTDRIAFGMGTYGSRSLPVGGSAIVKAMDKIVAKGKKIAAHMLEAAEADIEFKNGTFRVAGTDKGLSIGQIAFSAYVPHNFPLETVEPGLDETAFYDPKNFTFPNGTHICEVEVDEDTGAVQLTRFVAVDDFGRIINPMVVEGQVHGGIVQGVGQALVEDCIYDPTSGQLVTGSYMDYCMPKADLVPSFQVATNEGAPCTHNPLGVKGCGEAGTIGAGAAVINAVVDALKGFGVTHMDMPATPEKIWRAMHGKAAKAAE
ncbi:MAG: xanthine dehydrogenase family protein molybdopterin-binding subunit [Alphaproteobacteria bacterium]|nr:xanthine dehydrogenase family protein molybdopterin-binding subunit [Alphaproteobacteria bacterium]